MILHQYSKDSHRLIHNYTILMCAYACVYIPTSNVYTIGIIIATYISSSKSGPVLTVFVCVCICHSVLHMCDHVIYRYCHCTFMAS